METELTGVTGYNFSCNLSSNVGKRNPLQVVRDMLCLSQFQLGTSLNPRKIFLERANPGHPRNFFSPIPCPGAKNDGRISGGGAQFFPKSKKLLPKLLKTTRQYKFFNWRT